MRFGELIGKLDEEAIVSLARQAVPGYEDVPKPMLAHSVEAVLRESGHVEQSIQSLRPPVMAALRELLEAPDYRTSREGLEHRAALVGEVWMARVSSGDLVGRDESCRIYRRILTAAWQNDLKLDSSETSLLALLRAEVGMSAAEHFLIAYHPDIQPFWRDDDACRLCVDGLARRGIVFLVGGDVILPEEFVPRVRRTIGIFMHRNAASRLLHHLPNDDLKDALDRHRLKTSGSKSDRAERLLENLAPMPGVLESVHIHDLRALAKKVGAQVSGTKDDLKTRLIAHFDLGKDSRPDPSEVQHRVEPKVLSEAQFVALLMPLKGRLLLSLCERADLRLSGVKEVRIRTLWDSHLSENSLLLMLKKSDLADLCANHALDRRGAKEELASRLISDLSRLESTAATSSASVDEEL